MGRYGYYETPDYFYCPKCGKKKLLQEEGSYKNDYHKIWVCYHNRQADNPRKYVPVAERPKPCDCEITAKGRDAEISDYGDVLHKMSRISVHPVVAYLLENERDIYKKGLEVLHTSELMDVVRRRAGADDTAVAIYWRAEGRDSDEGLLNPQASEHRSLRSRAAAHVKFHGIPVSEIFARDGYRPWVKGSENSPFTGNLGKKVKRRIVNWALELERSLPFLIKKATDEHRRWKREEKAIEADIEPMPVHGYSGNDGTLGTALPQLTPGQAADVAAILGADAVRLNVLRVPPYVVSPEQMAAIEKAMAPEKLTVGIDLRRVTREEARALHAVCHTKMAVSS